MADDQPSASTSSARDDDAVVPEHIVRNVQTIAGMHVQAEKTVGPHQRAIESGTARLARPASLYVILAAVLVWALVNALGLRLGLRVPDPPPFAWLQGVIGLSALLTSAMVLITQNRQAKLAERRMHLDLQVNLLTEQKTAKLIELLEELRRDLPNVPNRRDAEAEVMQHAAEPLKVVAAIEEHAMEAIEADLTAQRDDSEAARET